MEYASGERGGYVVVAVVLILVALFSVAIIGTALHSIIRLETHLETTKGFRAQRAAQSCMHDALLHVAREDDFASSSLSLIGEYDCSVVVSSSDSRFYVTTTASVNTYSARVIAVVDRLGDEVSIQEWKEY